MRLVENLQENRANIVTYLHIFLYELNSMYVMCFVLFIFKEIEKNYGILMSFVVALKSSR